MFDATYFDNMIRSVGEIGYVTETKFPIAVTNGLPGARLNEMVLFESGDLGYVFSLEPDSVQVAILNKHKIPVGTRVTRTNKKMSYSFNESNAGKVTNPLGEILVGDQSYDGEMIDLSMFVDIPPLISRRNVKDQLVTGITTIDLLIPIGQGQRELLIGDRRTGKRPVVLQICNNAAKAGIKVVFAAVGQNNADIHIVRKFFEDNGVFEHIHLVATSPLDSPCMIYCTPFSAMAIAEHYCRQGFNSLVIVEDLTTHAQFYREFSLVSGRLPGRESYPGDIFYTHAHLLERAGTFDFGDGKEVSLTCLPLLHSPEGDISTYIATNSIGITDGHLFFDKERYLRGVIPPIHIALSVTRAGKQTQPQILRDINRTVTTFLSEYEATKSFSSFGSEMSDSVKETMDKGDLITTFLRQNEPGGHSIIGDVILLSLIWNKLFVDNTLDAMKVVRISIDKNLQQLAPEMQVKILSIKNFNDLNKYITDNLDLVLQICELKK